MCLTLDDELFEYFYNFYPMVHLITLVEKKMVRFRRSYSSQKYIMRKTDCMCCGAQVPQNVPRFYTVYNAHADFISRSLFFAVNTIPHLSHYIIESSKPRREFATPC